MVDYLVSYKLQEPLSVQLGGCFGAKWLRSREIDYDYYTNNSQDFSDNYSYGSLVEEMFMDYGLVAGITAGNEDVQFCLNYKHYFRNMFAGYMTDYTAHNGVLELKILVLTDFGY
ncbi:hypothetical protein SDC9_66814 [bioreactor metagenome]|uniref:Uncharacterized protein n=1 Tax=bioreactor metagenome TaxID=1076179 RepID=A0A644Y2L5_9ZZZZ